MPDLLHFLQKTFDFLTPSQENAARKLQEFFKIENRCFLLKGYAGTGKTTLLYGITRYLSTHKIYFRLMAPTGRAAKVISNKTKFDSYTIHKSIYSMNSLQEYKETNEDGSETFKYFFGLQNNNDPTETIYIVDESSMVSNQYSEGEFFRFGTGFLLNDLLTHIGFTTPKVSRKILFIGDSAQLPPVKMKFSPALDKKYLSDLPFALTVDETEMVDVVRQRKDSGVLINATDLREQISKSRFNKIKINTQYDDTIPIEHQELVDKYYECSNQEKAETTIIIAGTNKSVQRYNEAIRMRIFPGKKEIEPNDLFLVVRNNYKYGVLNGEFGIIKSILSITEKISLTLKKKTGEVSIDLRFKDVTVEVQDISGNPIEFDCKIIENLLDSKNPQLSDDEQRALYVLFKMKMTDRGIKPNTPEFKEAIKTDQYFNALLIKYGYAVTCHKAQGGEWHNSIVDFYTSSSPFKETYFRWCYTALTRCEGILYSLNEPKLGPSDNLKILNNIDNHIITSIPTSDSIDDIDIDIPEHLELNNYFEIFLYKEILYTIGYEPSVESISHNQYAERYVFATIPKRTTIDFIYDKKKTIGHIRLIQSGTNSEQLVKNLNQLIGRVFIDKTKNERLVNYFPEQKPYLEEFYKDIEKKLKGLDIEITRIEHFQYLEKYSFYRKNDFALIHFHYDGDGRFTTVIPQYEKNNSPELIHTIIDTL